QAIGRRVGARGRRIDRCAAFGTEPVRPLVPAFSSLNVDFRCSAPQNEGPGQARHVRAKGGAGEGLTIGAMADSDLGRVDFSLEADLTTMAASGDFHRHSPLTVPARCWTRVTAKITRLGASSNGEQPRGSAGPSESFRSSNWFSIGGVVVALAMRA